MSEIWPMVPKIALKCKTVNQTVIKYLVNNAWGTLAECRWLEVRSCEGPKDQKGPKPRSQGPEDFPYEMKLCGWSVEMGQLMVPACRHHPLLMVFPSTIQRQNNAETLLKPGETTLSWWSSLLQSRDKTMSSYFESFLKHFWNLSETGEICVWIVSWG